MRRTVKRHTRELRISESSAAAAAAAICSHVVFFINAAVTESHS